MSTDRRWVFDANVLISAALFINSVPGQALVWALKTGSLLLSDALVKEVDGVLRRPRFDLYLRQEDRDRFLTALIREATLVEIDISIRSCRDPDDDRLLELAVCGKADALVTGDGDLRALNPFREIPILSPAEFLASYRRE